MLIITLLITAFVAATYLAVSFVIFLYSPASFSRQELIVDIPEGANFRKVTKLLYDDGLIKNERKFRILGRIMKADSKIKAGELRFYKNMNSMQVLDTLIHGIPVGYTFTVPEGFNMYQIADMLASKKIIKDPKDFLTAARDKVLLIQLGIKGNSAEGYLFPNTYTVNKVRDVRTLVKLMNKDFNEVFTKDLSKRAHEIGLSDREAITLASIIEKETGAKEERKLVSSVFHNRLKKGMPLQSDPTTIYGMWDRYTGKITKEDLQQYTPYNTYKIHGLPPGPIANPGRDSIIAALYPEQTPYLYFVSRNDGTHTFSENYGDHRKAVNKLQKDPKAREGKSWRDLNKKGHSK
jgi:UPF0755 protein